MPRELNRKDITNIGRIGGGAFGDVHKAMLDESASTSIPGYLVAVKTALTSGVPVGAEQQSQNDLLQEAMVMAQVPNHLNVVALVGVVTSGAPWILAVSYCEHGSLLDVLHKSKEAGETSSSTSSPARLTAHAKLQMAEAVASGMAHLIAHRFIHRDLAARNCLVSSGMVCKVADFGLSRSGVGGGGYYYYRSQAGVFPVRWTAPEAMTSFKFSASSDVWSFGIVLLELFTDGAKPYGAMLNALLVTKILGGYRAPQPAGCPDAAYDVMLRCWAEDAKERPPFSQLLGIIAGARNALQDVEERPTVTTGASSAGYNSATGQPLRRCSERSSNPPLGAVGSRAKTPSLSMAAGYEFPVEGANATIGSGSHVTQPEQQGTAGLHEYSFASSSAALGEVLVQRSAIDADAAVVIDVTGASNSEPVGHLDVVASCAGVGEITPQNEYSLATATHVQERHTGSEVRRPGGGDQSADNSEVSVPLQVNEFSLVSSALSSSALYLPASKTAWTPTISVTDADAGSASPSKKTESGSSANAQRVGKSKRFMLSAAGQFDDSDAYVNEAPPRELSGIYQNFQVDSFEDENELNPQLMVVGMRQFSDGSTGFNRLPGRERGNADVVGVPVVVNIFQESQL
jgi:serine/threonine protein kinase